MPAMRWYPLKFRPIYKPRIWGGHRLREVFGKDLPEGQTIGESWELADLPGDQSVITNGTLAGQTLAGVMQRHGQPIAGRPDLPSPFPLLIKFLDAQDWLSVQVHPDAQACRRLGHGQPKSECWVIVDAPAHAFIYKGLRPGTTPQALRKAIAHGQVADLLRRVPVKPGQCHYLPAGTVHALGPGILVAEVQTPSDTTFRVFDWNRLDDTGKPRQLHLDQAMESIHFQESDQTCPVTSEGRLVDCPFFLLDKVLLAAGSRSLLSPGFMKVLLVLAGLGRITDGAGCAVDFRAGDCLLVPAPYTGTIGAERDTEYLVATV